MVDKLLKGTHTPTHIQKEDYSILDSFFLPQTFLMSDVPKSTDHIKLQCCKGLEIISVQM